MSHADFLQTFGGLGLAAMFAFFGFRALQNGEVHSRGGWYSRHTEPLAFWMFTGVFFFCSFICIVFSVASFFSL